jgi:hypothetical protein
MPRTICVFVFILALSLVNCGGSKSNPTVISQLPAPSPSPAPNPSPLPSPTPAPASAFIYAIITEPAAPHGDNAPNELRGWGLRGGQLVPVGNPAISLIPNSGSERFLSVSPRNKLLYMIDADGVFSNRLSSFTIGSDGSLSQTGPAFELGDTFTPMAFDPGSNFMFVTSDDGLHEFRIDADTDQLAELPGSPFPVGSSNVARGIVIHPSGRWIYVSNATETWGYALDSGTGGLTPLAGNPLATGREQVINIDPFGSFLYVDEVFTNGLRVYSIDSSGDLQLRFDAQVPYVGFLASASFDQVSGTAYLSSGFDINSAKLQLATIDSGNGTMNFLPQSPLVIPEDLPSDGHMIGSPVIRQADRTAVVPSMWAIYLFRLNSDGTLLMPPLAHVDATDGFWFTIDSIAVTH